MSTKIYNGFRYDGSLLELHHLTMEWRKRVETLAYDFMAEFIAVEGCEMIDRAAMDGAEMPKRVRLGKWWEFLNRNEEIAKTGRRDVQVDVSFGFTVIPVDGLIIGIPFAEKWIDEFLELPGMHDFSYWNNSDRPRTIRSKEWKIRKAAWDKALPVGNSAPGKNGFHADCAPSLYNVPDVERVLPFVRTRVERAEAYARLRTIKPNHPRPETIDGMISWMDENRSWQKTDEGREAIKTKVAEILDLLPEITAETLE